MVSIAGYGAYVPLYRIARGTIADQHDARGGDGEVAVPAHDESVLTMGVSAAKQALDRSSVDGSALSTVLCASVSETFDERAIAPHVAFAVDAPTSVRVADLESSARAAGSALGLGGDAVGRSGEPVLIVASDVIRASPGSEREQIAGAGAGAVVLAPDDVGDVATIDAAASNTTGFVGSFTHSGGETVIGDERFNRRHGYLDGVSGAIEALGDADELSPDHAVLPAPRGDWGSRALSATSFEADRWSTFDAIGYAGTAGALLDLALALDNGEPGEELLFAAYGSGGSDAMSFTLGAGVEGDLELSVRDYLESKEHVPYGKHQSYRTRAGGDA